MQGGIELDQVASDVLATRPEGLEGENVHNSVEMSRFRSAMTHQYKQMQKEYNDELDSLNKTLH